MTAWVAEYNVKQRAEERRRALEAAAPDMLRVLEAVAEQLGDWLESEHMETGLAASFEGEIRDAQSECLCAIARAKGLRS